MSMRIVRGIFGMVLVERRSDPLLQRCDVVVDLNSGRKLQCSNWRSVLDLADGVEGEGGLMKMRASLGQPELGIASRK